MDKQTAQDKVNEMMTAAKTAGAMDRLQNEGGEGFESETAKLKAIATFAKQIEQDGLYLMGNKVIDASDFASLKARWNTAVQKNTIGGTVNQAQVEAATGLKLASLGDAKRALGL